MSENGIFVLQADRRPMIDKAYITNILGLRQCECEIDLLTHNCTFQSRWLSQPRLAYTPDASASRMSLDH